MNYKVVYFTRTGNSRRVAEKIAKALSTEAIEITDNMNWQGVFGFIKGGFYASKNREVVIQVPENINGAEELIVVTPLWANKVTPAIHTFLKAQSLEKIHLVVTSGGSVLVDRSGYKSISDIVKRNNNEEEVISNLINSLS